VGEKRYGEMDAETAKEEKAMGKKSQPE